MNVWNCTIYIYILIKLLLFSQNCFSKKLFAYISAVTALFKATFVQKQVDLKNMHVSDDFLPFIPSIQLGFLPSDVNSLLSS